MGLYINKELRKTLEPNSLITWIDGKEKYESQELYFLDENKDEELCSYGRTIQEAKDDMLEYIDARIERLNRIKADLQNDKILNLNGKEY